MLDKHSIQVMDPSAATDFLDRTILGQKIAVAYTATAGTVYPITFTDPLPQTYSVHVTMSSASAGGAAFVTLKTASGFSITIPGTPTAGVMDILVVAA